MNSSVPTALARVTTARWATTLNTKSNGPSMMKPLAADLPVVIDQTPQDTVSYGIEDNEKGIYWVKFKFSTKEIDDSPLETVMRVQEQLLDLIKHIKSQWISK
jgi:hypothetical protein